MASIDTLVEDIYQLFEGHICDEQNVEEFGKEIASLVSSRLSSYSGDRPSYLRLSNIGKPCDRSIYYDVKGFDKEPLLPHTKIKFLFGDLIEAMLLFLAKEAGHKVSRQQERVELNGIVGHIDAVIDDVLVDVKSASSYAFKKFKEGTLPEQDSFGYIAQISGYKQALGIERAGFLAMDKQNGHLCLYEPHHYINSAGRIDHLKEILDNEEEPHRAFDPQPDGKSGNLKLCVECSYCGHKKSCWPELRTFLYSTGPKHLVHVEKEPNVPEITDDSESELF